MTTALKTAWRRLKAKRYIINCKLQVVSYMLYEALAYSLY